MRKRILSLALTLVMLLAVLPFGAVTARAAETSGSLGGDITWTYDTETGVFTISGTGEMDRFDLKIPEEVRSQAGTVVIENGVTAIVPSLFSNFVSMTRVQIPDSVSTIGESAFYGCEALTEIRIPQNVTAIWESTFEGCESLAHVELPEGLIGFGRWAFKGCKALTDIDLPDSLEEICGHTFMNCTGLTSIRLGEKVFKVDTMAFKGCENLTNIQVDSGNPFYYTDSQGALYASQENMLCLVPKNVTGTFTIQDGTKEIGYRAFEGCDGITDVVIPDSMEDFPKAVFLNTAMYRDEANWEGDVFYLSNWAITIRSNGGGEYTIRPGTVGIAGSGLYDAGSITKIVIPKGVRWIGSDAFCFKSNLSSVELPSTLLGIGRETFRGCTDLSEIKLPEGLRTIGSGAFQECSFTGVQIPASVTQIDQDAFYGAFVFPQEEQAGTGTLGFTVAEGNPAYCADERGVLYDRDKTELIQAPRNMSESKAGHSYTVPDSVKKIASHAFFYCDEVWDITLPDSLERIGEGAFVRSGVWNNFGAWEAQGNTSVLYISDYLIGVRSSSDANGSYRVRESTRLIADGAFMYCDGLEEIIFPDSLRYIGSNAFESCQSLTEVALPDNVVEIGDGAFQSCVNLEKITLSRNLRRIGAEALWSCGALTELTIPAGVEQIGESAFLDNEGLRTVDFQGGAPELGEHAFQLVMRIDMEGAEHFVYNPNLTLYYEAGKPGWTSPTWEGYPTAPRGTHTHSYTEAVVAPTCTEQGYTIHQCQCGDSYKDGYVDALGHSYKNGVCTRCGAQDPNAGKPISNPFVDVGQKDYYYDAVLWAVDQGVTASMDVTHFAPNGTCTRAQVVAFLWRAAGKPEPSSAKNPFTDVSSGDYFYKAVLWAAENGIVYGTSTTKFSPNASCTRAQVVCFLYRYQNSPSHGTNNPFRDVKDGAYYYDAVLWAAENGVVYGTDTTHFSPDKTCTRGQVVCFLYRLLG